jgi:hypothetical protein
MKRYGQRMITLKDMLVEYLMAHMEGATFVQLQQELGASVVGLTALLVKMVEAGELLKVTRELVESFWPAPFSSVRLDEHGVARFAPLNIVFKLSPRMWIEEAAGI